ncbi:hypothetical protein K7B10_39300 [Streptomyces flavotricini]|uniref:Uncharacterized protein n=2 Tax=Streptomyces TaxID=1883 RepID=A0ABS8EHS7_9ACTN|nr:hypothetical protein [Streptomyces flavotricini]MCC0100700.1 hypothetical protein [Streptomyces flavotricini]
MTTMAAPRRTAPYRVGDLVTGTSYVAPQNRGRESPELITGRVVQVGSGWDGIDADQAYVWVRLASGRERQALIRDIQKVTL